jgi:integrase/recombinase XerC
VDYLSEYLDFLHFERGLSDNTRNNYERDIQQLIALSQPTSLASLQIVQIRKYVAILHSKGLGGKSIVRMLSSWRGFFDYLVRRHQFKNNPVIGMRAPKSPKTLPQALSIEQANKLVEIIDDDILSQRDHAILELFYSSGLRLSELVGLNVDQLDFTEGTVTVTGKGNKTRIVPLGGKAKEAIAAWLTLRQQLLPRNPSEKAVFISKQGRRISGRNIEYRLKAWSIKQGINSAVHPHMLRHSFASHVLQSSGDLRAVQEMLGHANISTTQVYTHLDYQHLTKVYDAAHPRAKKK